MDITPVGKDFSHSLEMTNKIATWHLEPFAMLRINFVRDLSERNHDHGG
jgi:hypothetical protein